MTRMVHFITTTYLNRLLLILIKLLIITDITYAGQQSVANTSFDVTALLTTSNLSILDQSLTAITALDNSKLATLANQKDIWQQTSNIRLDNFSHQNFWFRIRFINPRPLHKKLNLSY